MIKELVHDDAILSQPCEPATAEDAPLAQDLLDTMEATEDAACLAANQIGVAKALVVFADDEGRTHVMYNPKRCLSHDDDVKVTRFAKAKVSFEELVDGELKPRRRDFTGWVAQMVQHMIDHCNGKLV